MKQKFIFSFLVASVCAEDVTVIDLTQMNLVQPTPAVDVPKPDTSTQKYRFDPERCEYRDQTGMYKMSVMGVPEAVALELSSNPKSTMHFARYKTSRATCLTGGFATALGLVLALVNTESRLTGKKVMAMDENNMPIIKNNQFVYEDEEELVMSNAGKLGLGLSVVGAITAFASYQFAKEHLTKSMEAYMSPYKSVTLEVDPLRQKLGFAYAF